jgi:hypothetical protein
LPGIARYLYVRYSPNIFHEPPCRPGPNYNANKFIDQGHALLWVTVPVYARKRLAGRATYHTIETAGRGGELVNVTTKDEIRAANNTKPLVFKTFAE